MKNHHWPATLGHPSFPLLPISWPRCHHDWHQLGVFLHLIAALYCLHYASIKFASFAKMRLIARVVVRRSARESFQHLSVLPRIVLPTALSNSNRLFSALLSPSGDLGIGLVWDNHPHHRTTFRSDCWNPLLNAQQIREQLDISELLQIFCKPPTTQPFVSHHLEQHH